MRAAASLVIMTLVKPVISKREHLLAGEMRPVLVWSQYGVRLLSGSTMCIFSCSTRIKEHTSHFARA